MPDWPHWSALPSETVIGLLVVLGYPVLTLAALEAARAFGAHRRLAPDLLRQTALLLLPAGAVWLILRVLAGLPADDWAVRTAETAFALIGLSLVLRLAQAALVGMLDTATQAPKLLLDILRIGVSLVWGAVVVSHIWDVDLGSLFAAMGVGSIVLGFAMQEFLGNLLSGLGLLSAHKFGIGDWIVVDGGAAQVVEMDWRTVTLSKGGADRIVVANSTLAKGNLVIAGRANAPASASVPLAFGVEIPPEQVRGAVLEAAGAGASCTVTGIANGVVTYVAGLPVASPGVLAGPRDEFLSRFWYVAQRRGLRLDTDPARAVPPPPDAGERLRMLMAAGAFQADGDALALLAAASMFRRYRRGDVLLQEAAPITEAFLMLAGGVAVTLPHQNGRTQLELVDGGDLLVLHETQTGGASPVLAMAEQDTDVLAIPAAALHDIMDRNRTIARDVRALAEARRLAIATLGRGLRSVA